LAERRIGGIMDPEVCGMARGHRLAIVLLLGASLSSADDIHLRGGGRITGTIVERTPQTVTIDIGAGRVSIPADRIERVDPGRSAAGAFAERAQRLGRSDVQGWLDLALWARDQGLATQARQAFERVVEVDPKNVIAQKALGNVLVGELWVSQEEAYRQQGYVLYQGEWMPPSERDNRIALARAEVELEGTRVEAEARAREAEARAREAEAEAARAAEGGTNDPGVYAVPLYPRIARRHRDHDRGDCGNCDHDGQPRRRPEPQPTPAPTPTPRSGKTRPPTPATQKPASTPTGGELPARH
jgi:hypothetical protein